MKIKGVKCRCTENKRIGCSCVNGSLCDKDCLGYDAIAYPANVARAMENCIKAMEFERDIDLNCECNMCKAVRRLEKAMEVGK